MAELYSEQDVETKIIVPQLDKLGYKETKRGDIALRFQHPISVHQGRQKKTIRADVVVFVNDAPVIVIDSKNPREYLSENDREQVISYARLVGDIAPYSVLCNGHTWQFFDTITKTQLAGLPSRKELLKDLQKRRVSPKQRISLATQARRTLFAIDSARELSRIMRRCHDIIRNLKGYDPTKAFDELSKVLFAKMYEERELADGRRTVNRFTSMSVKSMREQGVEIIQTLWKDTVASDRYMDVFGDEGTASDIQLPPEAIDQIVAILEDKSLGLTDLDVKGIAFEEFLSSTYRGGGLGQFFTPREVVSFMVDLADVSIGERVIDPSCGTGGFLIRTYDVVSEKIRGADLSDREKKLRLAELANNCLAGIDWEPRAARTCKMNMIIHGDGHAGVYQGNSLDYEEINDKVRARQRYKPNAASIDEGAFDIVLTNPPFGATDRTRRILDYFEMGRGPAQKREVLMLERCIRLLRPGGRLLVVLPEGILSNKRDQRIRDFICQHCIIKAVIRLPQDTFAMSEGAKCTSILYALKREEEHTEQGDLFLARAEYIGITPSGKPIPENDLIAIKEHYRRFESGKWDGIELTAHKGNIHFIRHAPTVGEALWLEPKVNRTSQLYDRLSYVVKDPDLSSRFSYTFFHPSFFQAMKRLEGLLIPVVKFNELCEDDFPRRGKKPSEESVVGIPILKVRNVTGSGISAGDADCAPDTEQIRKECRRALVAKNDILITSTGEGTIGRVDIYGYDDPAIADGHVTICRLKPGIRPEYVVEYLRGEYGQIQILRHISGSTGQTELLVDYLRNLLIPLPDPKAQQQFIRQMNMARAKADEMTQKATQLLAKGASLVGETRAKAVDAYVRDVGK